MIGSRSIDADRLLAEACSRDVACLEWRALLEGLLKSPERDAGLLAEIADRMLKAAFAEGGAWGDVRRVAEVRTSSGNRAGARASLEVGEQMLSARPSTGYEWAGVARQYVRALADGAAARRCVERGLECARRSRDVGALCWLADVMAEVGDLATARSMVNEAEALLDGTGWGVSSVASALEDLEAPGEVGRVLRQAIASARDASAAIGVAEFRRRDEGVEHVAPALERARELAQTAVDWYSIAEVGHRVSEDVAVVRAALDRAASGAHDDVLRRRIALAFHLWLADAEAADRVGPRGFRPEMLRAPRRKLEGSVGSASGLFDWLRARVTREMLAEIARADYDHDTDEHLAALVDIQVTGLLPPQLPWHPREVVSLTRWAPREDLQGAWCATLLWLCSGDEDPANIVPGLVDSCLRMEVEAADLAARMLVWHVETEARDLSGLPPSDESIECRDPVLGPDEDVEPHALLGLLLLRAATDPDDPRIDVLVQRINASRPGPKPLTWGISEAHWRELALRILCPVVHRHPELATLLERLRLVACDGAQ